ncbi:ribonuclease H-like domain-containing protein [Tanacetum coccineum]
MLSSDATFSMEMFPFGHCPEGNGDVSSELKAKHPFKSAPSLPDTHIDHHLTTSHTVVLDRIKTFPQGTTCGRDGLRAQHLMDCLSGAAVAVLDDLVSSITQVVNLFLAGKCPVMLGEYIASAPLTLLVKLRGSICPIVERGEAILSRFHGLTSSISPIHKSPFVALSDPHWRDAIRSQQFGVYCDDTFCLVVKPATIRTVLLPCALSRWHSSANVKNAFLNEDLSETVIPFELFSPRVGVTRLSLFIDMVLRGMFLSQKKYAMKLLEWAHMANCNPTWTLVDTESKLGCDGDPVSDPTLYCSLAGGLQYLTFTPPDISYAVQKKFLLMHDPREPHLAALKYILRYVQYMDFGSNTVIILSYCLHRRSLSMQIGFGVPNN